jgi:hypothetical protein
LINTFREDFQMSKTKHVKTVKTKARKSTTNKNRKSQTNTSRSRQSIVMKGISRIWFVSTLALVVSTLVFSFIPKQTVESLNAKTALIYGDSVTHESRTMVAQYSATKVGWKHTVRAYGGTAPCDWITWLPTDLATHQPSIVAISTMGNVSVTGCTNDGNGNNLVLGSQAYYDKYRADLNTFMQLVTATGAKIVFIKAPPTRDTTRNAAIDQIHLIAQELAGQYHGVSISNTVRSALSASGKYTDKKACLASETVTQGCGTDGKIAIRSWDGLHLCPITLAAYATCNVYSSGEYRWAKAAVNTTVNPPAPVLP